MVDSLKSFDFTVTGMVSEPIEGSDGANAVSFETIATHHAFEGAISSDAIAWRDDGGLTWKPGVMRDRGAGQHWIVEIAYAFPDHRRIPVDVNCAAPSLDGAVCEALFRFLDGIPTLQRRFVADIAKFPDIRRFLVSDLFAGLKPETLAVLFPGCTRADDVDDQRFFDALTLSRIGCYPGAPEGYEVVVDYRFLVFPGGKRPDDLTRYMDYDVTDQIVAVQLKLDGTLVSVSHDS